MHHVAIMKKSWRLIPKILSGEKTIESRWYQTRRAPWGQISKGDTIFFKNSGEPITASAEVLGVLQFELSGVEDVERLIRRYGKKICLVDTNPRVWKKVPRYCILIELGDPRSVQPFGINKKGFGSAAAWLTIPDIGVLKTRT